MEFFSLIFQCSQQLLLIGAGLLGLTFLVTFHEFGHFLFCKLFGIHTPTFSVGFGPKIASKKIGETEFVLASIPLGGYVEIAGVAEVGQGEQKLAHSTDAHSFAQKPYYQKFLVMTGGILFNLIFAYAALLILSLAGTYNIIVDLNNKTPIIETIQNTSPFKINDVITAVDGFAVYGQLPLLTEKNKNNRATELNTIGLEQYIKEGKTLKKPFDFTILREGKEQHISVLPEQAETDLSFTFKTISLGNRFLNGIKQANTMIKETVVGIFNMFKRRSMKGAQGPLGIISTTAQCASRGFSTYLALLVVISISLAMINLLPLPILDGGQILTTTIESIIQRPISLKIKEYIHIATWLILLTFILYISFYDIKRIYLDVKQYLFGSKLDAIIEQLAREVTTEKKL